MDPRSYDVVVVGAGVAGLAFSLALPEGWRVALLTKGVLGESNTRYAQGGISAAIGPDDSTRLHETDTLVAGAGLCDPAAVRALVDGAPSAIDRLLAIGTKFDRSVTTGEILLGREAAHSRHRVLHAGGDATGAEVERALVAAARTHPDIDVFDHAYALDLLVCDARACGISAELANGERAVLAAPWIVIAAGGAGQLWAITSNPKGATADGLAMAVRAGVAVADMEFVQFHPTVLALAGTEPFLITEAVRGEGAYLLNDAGERFMLAVHPLAELAPRDVVARGIQSAMAADDTDHVWLDLRHLPDELVYKRFPTITRELKGRGLDLASDLIPVAPAAHYFIGGIAASTDGRTSLPGLLALGEAACTGVHGANRLASNSLLEGLVFGTDAAALLTSLGRPRAIDTDALDLSGVTTEVESGNRAAIAKAVAAIQRVMSQHVAVVRSAEGLREAAAEVERLTRSIATAGGNDRVAMEASNIAQAASNVIAAALFREESRGAHFRSDFPDTNPALDGRHSLLFEGDAGEWRFGALSEAFDRSSIIREPATI
ncbi:MAG TPA: L-aspartate oxidase [Thermomicrobiales bacterium]|nr:L-aspartate oxidase [Thermomicrobiales bacterium]